MGNCSVVTILALRHLMPIFAARSLGVPEYNGLRSYPLNLIRVVPAKGNEVASSIQAVYFKSRISVNSGCGELAFFTGYHLRAILLGYRVNKKQEITP